MDVIVIEGLGEFDGERALLVHLAHELRHIRRTIEENQVATEAEIQQVIDVAAEIAGDLAPLRSELDALNTQIADLESRVAGAADPALDAAIASLKDTASNLSAMVPAPADGGDVAVADSGSQTSDAPASTSEAVFIPKIDGETYDDYVARAQAAGFAVSSQDDWNALPVQTTL